MVEHISGNSPGELPRHAGKIVVVRAKRVGDFLCAVPAMRAIRRGLPEAEITLVAMPIVQDLVQRSPHIDRFRTFPGYPGMAEQFFDARLAAEFFQRMQAEQFDLAIQMHGSGVYSNPFTLMLGAKKTVGFVRPGDGPGRLDAALPLPESMHEIHRLLALVAVLGLRPVGEYLEMPLTSSDHTSADRLLSSAEPPWIGLHSGARADAKRWPLDCFAAVGAKLHRRHGGTIVLLGGSEERSQANALASRMGIPCLSLVGKTTLPELGAVISRLSVLVTNDSGPAHVAYALRTPTVCLYLTTNPDEWGPLERERHRTIRCEATSPESSLSTVIEAASSILERRLMPKCC